MRARRRADQRVVDPHRLDPQLRQLLGRQAGQAVAHRRQRRQHRRPSPSASRSSPWSLWDRSSRAAAPAPARRMRPSEYSSIVETIARSIRSALAQRLDDLLLAAGQLDVEVDLDLVQRRLEEGVERLGQRQRRAPLGVGPVVGDDQRRPLLERQVARRAARARRARSCRRRPRPRRAKLSSVLPGAIRSAPLWPTRRRSVRRH